MKLHIGCGSVYLDGWVNVDLPGDHMALASKDPDLTAQLRTTADAYYARHEDKTIERLRVSPVKVLGVCDAYGDAQNLPFADGSASAILARQVFEHLSISEAKRALAEFRRVLCDGGFLELDVPDVEETARLLTETKDPFYVRHLFGSRKDEYGYHLMGYTRDGLRALCEASGFSFLWEEPSIHYYPAFSLMFTPTV